MRLRLSCPYKLSSRTDRARAQCTTVHVIITRGIFSKALGAAELWPSLLALLVTSPLLLLASVAGLKKQEK